MPVFLDKRQPGLVEQMDRDDCDLRLLQNTYSQFHRINGMLSQWKRIYRSRIRPAINNSRSYTLLDVGFGGGDITRSLKMWSLEDGLDLNVMGIETDERAMRYASELDHLDGLEFRHISTTDLLKEQKQFDFVVSNHVLHHLDQDATLQILDECKTLSSSKVIFNDIERSDIGYAAFNVFSRVLFSDSFITEDGLTSIKKSYTYKELKELAPPQWKVKRLFPFRLILEYEH